MEEGAGKRCSECDQYPNFLKGADRVGGQLRGDKKYRFSGVTKSGRVWRKVTESDARSVGLALAQQTGNHSLTNKVKAILSLASSSILNTLIDKWRWLMVKNSDELQSFRDAIIGRIFGT